MVKELVVPCAVVGVLASMLLPVPPIVMDFLLVGNLILALVLFLSTLHIPDTLRLSSLPSMLLLATLYRLALNISTTRNILSTGDGGKVVEAFGAIVIQGNLVVGLVVFLIITLVQFIVIAKGSERVAEVAARFTLDALPGKQMSIDADVRAGLLDLTSARGKRQDLQMESRFYGALDGAMKFIKGDAIAGIVITAINIVGGLAIGVFSEHLSVSQAVSKYTILTVGDGLVAQIPALLNSLAAGIVVTRVARGDDASLAAELLSQLGQVRKVKVLSGVLCLLLACVPGMPALPFLTLAAVLLANAWISGNPVGVDGSGTQNEVFAPRPPALLNVVVGREAAAALHTVKGFAGAIDGLRITVHNNHGVILPYPEFTVSESLGFGFQIQFRGIPLPVDPGAQSGTELVTKIVSALGVVTLARLVECIDDVATRKALDSVEKVAPELASAVVPGIVTVTQLTEILKNLVMEGVPIQHFDQILQAVAEHGPRAGNDRALLEEVRIALKRVISHRYSNGTGILRVVTIDPVIDLSLARSERERAVVDLTLIDRVAEFARGLDGEWCFLVSRSARRVVREFLLLKGIARTVLAHEEIVSEQRLESAGHIELHEQQDGGILLERLAA